MKKYYSLFFILFIGLIIYLPIIAGATIPQLHNPLGTTNISTITGNLINKVLSIVGVIAFAMFVYGGILWMTSAGSEEQIKKGKNTLVWATIGLAFIFFAYTLVHYILSSVMSSV